MAIAPQSRLEGIMRDVTTGLFILSAVMWLSMLIMPPVGLMATFFTVLACVSALLLGGVELWQRM